MLKNIFKLRFIDTKSFFCSHLLFHFNRQRKYDVGKIKIKQIQNEKGHGTLRVEGFYFALLSLKPKV